MSLLSEGARQAITSYLRIQKNELVVLITDERTRHVATALANAAHREGARTHAFVMEQFGSRTPDNPLKFPEEIGRTLEQANASIYAAKNAQGELQSFRTPLVRIVESSHVRHAHMPGITLAVMETGMRTDHNEIRRTTARVNERVRNAKKLFVTSPGGTELEVTVGTYAWVVCDGNITENHWTNLPDGETFTTPTTAEGVLVVDGVLGDYFDEKYGVLEETPVIIRVENGLATSILSKNRRVVRDLERYFMRDPSSARMGEAAIGTNTGIERIIGLMLQDEKSPGFHCAFGDPLGYETGAHWSCPTHVDCIPLRPTIYADDTCLMAEGVFVPGIVGA